MLVDYGSDISIKEGDEVYTAIYQGKKFEVIHADEKHGYTLKFKDIKLPFFIPESFLVFTK